MECKKLKGFTLIEIIVVMGVLTLLSMILMPYTIKEVKTSNVKSLAGDITSLMFSYQQEAYSGLAGKSYGFAFDSTGYYLFTCNTFATAVSKDRTDLPPSISVNLINFAGGTNEVVFSPGSLKPSVFGNIRLTDDGSTYEININAEGFIEYYKVS